MKIRTLPLCIIACCFTNFLFSMQLRKQGVPPKAHRTRNVMYTSKRMVCKCIAQCTPSEAMVTTTTIKERVQLYEKIHTLYHTENSLKKINGWPTEAGTDLKQAYLHCCAHFKACANDNTKGGRRSWFLLGGSALLTGASLTATSLGLIPGLLPFVFVSAGGISTVCFRHDLQEYKKLITIAHNDLQILAPAYKQFIQAQQKL